MTITLQGYLHREPIFVIPQTTITCQDCRLEETIQGDESIELEYDNAVDMEAVEERSEMVTIVNVALADERQADY
jgi:hypothetical protein